VEPDPDLLFEVVTPLGFSVRVTRKRWALITTTKHPIMTGREDVVRATLEHPDEVRRSQSDDHVFLFYQAERPSRWVCAVAKQGDGRGFLIIAYPTDAIKEGTKVWPK